MRGRFNNQYGQVFPEPEAKLTRFPRLPGLDGADRKMSKSAGNAILLSDSPDEIRKKLRGAVTDPLKVRKNDPGRPEICLIFTYHKKFNVNEVPTIETDCRSGALGCVECKMKVGDRIAAALAPLRGNAGTLKKNPDEVMQVLADGEERAHKVAGDTMNRVHDAMQLG